MEEETTLGHHRHQGSWTLTYESIPGCDDAVEHFEVFVCGECGIKFIHHKNSPLPVEEE